MNCTFPFFPWPKTNLLCNHLYAIYIFQTAHWITYALFITAQKKHYTSSHNNLKCVAACIILHTTTLYARATNHALDQIRREHSKLISKLQIFPWCNTCWNPKSNWFDRTTNLYATLAWNVGAATILCLKSPTTQMPPVIGACILPALLLFAETPL